MIARPDPRPLFIVYRPDPFSVLLCFVERFYDFGKVLGRDSKSTGNTFSGGLSVESSANHPKFTLSVLGVFVTGLNATTGQALSGFDHLRQSWPRRANIFPRVLCQLSGQLSGCPLISPLISLPTKWVSPNFHLISIEYISGAILPECFFRKEPTMAPILIP